MKRIFAIIFLLTIASCSKQKVNLSLNHFESLWFNVDKRFSYVDDFGDKTNHPFFDSSARESDFARNVYRAFVTTPPDSKVNYELDLRSGRLFRRNLSCSYSDVWNRYTFSFSAPNFAVGHIPRHLSQLGDPQKVYIFGNKAYFQGFRPNNPKLYKIRVLGGVVEQYCENFPCANREKWISSLSLIAVLEGDTDNKDLKNLDDFKKKYDFKKIKAYIENYQGAKVESENKATPAYRVLNEVSLANSIEFLENKSHIFNYKKAKALQKSCHNLYDYLWENAQQIRSKTSTKLRRLQTKQARSKYKTKVDAVGKLSGNVLNYEETIRPKEKVKKEEHSDFSHFFRGFYKKHKDKILTCSKYVQLSSINDNIERHWFLTMFVNYFQLENLGYAFDCSRQTWLKNPTLNNGKKLLNNWSMMQSCTTAELDRSFDQAVTVMAGLYRSSQPHYRYIEYDEFRGGSHQKLYSWIYSNGKRLSCEKSLSSQVPAFPDDISWKPFYLDYNADNPEGYIL